VRVQEMLGLLTDGGYQGRVSVEWEKRCTQRDRGA
jgi:hypothetical protein